MLDSLIMSLAGSLARHIASTGNQDWLTIDRESGPVLNRDQHSDIQESQEEKRLILTLVWQQYYKQLSSGEETIYIDRGMVEDGKLV